MIDLNNPEFANVDPLHSAYRKSIGEESRTHKQAIQAKNTALLVIDVQYLDAAEGYGVFSDPDNPGKEEREYYFKSLKEIVLPNIQKLQKTFRDQKLEIIHIRIQSLTQDGRDRSLGHKKLDLLAVPGSKEAEFLEEVAPEGDEIVINKTASGVFNSSNLLFVLRNLGITGLFVTGVYTNECVSTTVRDGSDLGFSITLIEDACTTVTPDLHHNTISVLRDRYARIETADQAVKEIEKLLSK
ncbi:MAG: cysteine hydrolase [Spirochaetia bacterium]|nr:cysteine hydrolase [Spirochaetia bacterium]